MPYEFDSIGYKKKTTECVFRGISVYLIYYNLSTYI